MCIMKPKFRCIVLVYSLVLGLFAAPDIMSRSAAEQAQPKAAPKQKSVSGSFVSFKDGTLTVEGGAGLLIKTKIQVPENAKTLLWNHDERRLMPVETAEAMKQLTALGAPIDPSHVDTAESMLWRKAGTGIVVQIADDNVTIRIGESKIPPFVGTFLSFKDDFLLFRLKNPSSKELKSYGDTVRFRMNETINVYESIDGGEYKRIGTPRTAFANVKEGSTITVYHFYKTETDEFYLVLIGVKKK